MSQPTINPRNQALIIAGEASGLMVELLEEIPPGEKASLVSPDGLIKFECLNDKDQPAWYVKHKRLHFCSGHLWIYGAAIIWESEISFIVS